MDLQEQLRSSDGEHAMLCNMMHEFKKEVKTLRSALSIKSEHLDRTTGTCVHERLLYAIATVREGDCGQYSTRATDVPRLVYTSQVNPYLPLAGG